VPVQETHPTKIAEDTVVVVSLKRSIGSRLSPVGQPFEARLVSPIQTKSGKDIAVDGAILTGTVVSRSNGLGLRFDTIDTVHGPVHLRARLIEIMPDMSMGVTNADRDAGGADVRICPAPGVPRGKRKAPGPGKLTRCRGTVLLRAGVELRLQLFDVSEN
jgi:hypothetical protein